MDLNGRSAADLLSKKDPAVPISSPFEHDGEKSNFIYYQNSNPGRPVPSQLPYLLPYLDSVTQQCSFNGESDNLKVPTYEDQRNINSD
jgi:hypothetical protein